MNFLFGFYILSLLGSQSAMDFSTGLIGILVFGLLVLKKVDTPALPIRLFVYAFGLFIAAVVSLTLSSYTNFSFVKNLSEFQWIIEVGVLVTFLEKYKLDKWKVDILSIIFLICSVYALLSYITNCNVLLELVEHRAICSSNHSRLNGLFGHSMPFAHTYGLFWTFLFGFIYSSKQNQKILNYLALIAGLLCLIWAESRGVWLSVAISILVYVVILSRRHLLKVIFLGATITSFLYFMSEGIGGRIRATINLSVNGDHQRSILYKSYWQMFLDHPIWGVGFNLNKDLLRSYYDKLGVPPGFFEGHAHNQYLQWLASTGIVGCSLYVLLFSSIILLTFRAYKITKDHFIKSVSLASLVTQICFHIGSLTEANFAVSKNRHAFLLFVSIGIYCYLRSHPKTQVQSS